MQVLEKARTGKMLGAALEAKVLLHVGDTDIRGRLAALDACDNGADPLRYTFITSQASSTASSVSLWGFPLLVGLECAFRGVYSAERRTAEMAARVLIHLSRLA